MASHSGAGSSSYSTNIELRQQLLRVNRPQDIRRDEEPNERTKISKVDSFTVRLSPLRAKAMSFVSESKFRTIPGSTAMRLVFILFFSIGFAESGTTTTFFYLLNSQFSLEAAPTVAIFLLTRCLTFILYPFMGLLADVFFGHYKVILTSVIVGLIGSGLFAFVFAFIDPLFEPSYWVYSDCCAVAWSPGRKFALIVFYLLLWITFTGIRVNLIPFGVDQLPEASSRGLSSYFHWYYWFSCLGALAAALTLPIIYAESALSYAFLLITLSFTAMYFILVWLKKKLTITPNVGNPFKMIYQVLRYAAHAKRPAYRSAFQVGQPLPTRIELAMDMHGGKFTVETVENVKTFFRILFILTSFIGYYAVFSQLQSTYTLEGMRMTFPGYMYSSENQDHHLDLFSETNRTVDIRLLSLPPSFFFSVANLLPLIILIPLFDKVIYPCLGGHMPTMLTRIGIGKIFILASISIATGIEWYRQSESVAYLKNDTNALFINVVPFHTESSKTFTVSSPVSVFLILPQFVLFAFAEVLSNITAVEFIYAQSPAQMKGLLLGLLFGTEGVAMGFAAVIISFYDTAPDFSFCSFFANSNNYPSYVTATNDSEHECNARLQDGPAAACADGAFCVYLMFILITIIFIVVFALSSARYKLRKRDADPYLPNWW